MTGNTSDYQMGKVEIAALEPHPNADRLEVAVLTRRGEPFNYPVVVRKGQYAAGDAAFYLPVNTVISGEHPEFEFLSPGERACLRAKRLRGVYSEGLLVPMDDIRAVGARTGGQLPFARFLQKRRLSFGGQQSGGPPGLDVPVYGVENLRHGRALSVMDPDTEIEVTEKIHGMNIRFVVHEGRLHVGSHRTWRKGLNHAWGRALHAAFYGPPLETADLTEEDEAELCEQVASSFGEGTVVYGEVYGKGAQDLEYDQLGVGPLRLRVFDAWRSGGFARPSRVREFAERVDLECPPIIYAGKIRDMPTGIDAMAEGPTLLGGRHVREGVVVKTADGLFRGKWVGQGYKLRKNQGDFDDE